MQQAVSVAPGAPAPNALAGRVRARRFFWFTFLFLLVGVAIGLDWDRRWHASHVFDSFYSPPHLFVYSMTIVALLFMAAITLAPAWRVHFGPGFRLPFVRFAVPGALALTLGGFGVLGLAGVLDDFWHSHFGLDETGWSTPHAMIGWGLLLIVLGFVACRLALGQGRPLPAYTAGFLGWVVLACSATPFLGPLYDNKTPETVRAIASLPVLLRQPAAQHTYAIYLQWNLTRTNPLLIVLGTLWAGAALALLIRLAPRPRLYLAVVAVWSALTLFADYRTARGLDFLRPGVSLHPATWLPLPLLPAALILAVLLGRGVRPLGAWAGAGLGFGGAVWLIWGAAPWAVGLVLLAVPTMWLGAWLGTRIYGVLARPTARAVPALLAAGLLVPLVTGLLDLYLRHATPFP